LTFGERINVSDRIEVSSVMDLAYQINTVIHAWIHDTWRAYQRIRPHWSVWSLVKGRAPQGCRRHKSCGVIRNFLLRNASASDSMFAWFLHILFGQFRVWKPSPPWVTHVNFFGNSPPCYPKIISDIILVPLNTESCGYSRILAFNHVVRLRTVSSSIKSTSPSPTE